MRKDRRSIGEISVEDLKALIRSAVEAAMSGHSLASGQSSLMRLPDVESATGYNRLIKEGKFPAPVTMAGGRAAAWVRAEIDEWIEKAITSSRHIPLTD